MKTHAAPVKSAPIKPPPAPTVQERAPVAEMEPAEADRELDPRKQPGTPLDLHGVSVWGAGRPLDADLRARFESGFGQSLAGVRLHTGSPAASAARASGALALTMGPHIAFATGQFQPGSTEGRRLIAHELAHVLQQQRSPSGTDQRTAERDAERAASYVAAGRNVGPLACAPLGLYSASELKTGDLVVVNGTGFTRNGLAMADAPGSGNIVAFVPVGGLLRLGKSQGGGGSLFYASPMMNKDQAYKVSGIVNANWVRIASEEDIASAPSPSFRATKEKKEPSVEEAPAPPEPAPAPSPTEYWLEGTFEGGEATFFSDPKGHPKYVDKKVTGVGIDLMSGSYIIFFEENELPLLVHATYFNNQLQEAPNKDSTVYDSYNAAVKASGGSGVRYCYSAKGGIIIPTVFSPATTPRVMELVYEVNKLKAAELKALADALTIQVIVIGASIVGSAVAGWIFRRIMNRPIKGPPGTKELPPKNTGGKGKVPAGEGEEAAPAQAKPAAKVALPQTARVRNSKGQVIEVKPDGRGTIYHGSETTPQQIQAQGGLPPKGNNTDLLNHAQGGGDSAFRGGTKIISNKVADAPGGAAHWAGEGKYVYEIEGVPHWDVNTHLEGRVPQPGGGFGGNPAKGEFELAFPANTPIQNIRRWGKVERSESGALVVKSWHEFGPASGGTK
jgi:Domain of unknown function (DUF4157)